MPPSDEGAEITPLGPDPVRTGVGKRTSRKPMDFPWVLSLRTNMTQLESARKGIVTAEMEFVAKREDLEAELIR